MKHADETDQLDITKLHSESLQLRSQQFLLGTIALTGSGITAWITPGVAALTEKQIPEVALVGGTLLWLVLLAVLFEWSLALRQMISVISQYLELRRYSKWEPAFRLFPSALAPSQSGFIAAAFGLYGCIAFTSAILAHTAIPESVSLSSEGRAVLEAALVGYLALVIIRTSKREKGKAIKSAWESILGSGDSLQDRAPQVSSSVGQPFGGSVAESPDPTDPSGGGSSS